MLILLVKTVAEKPPVTLPLQLRIYQSFLSVNWIIYRYLLRKVYLEKTNSSILVIIPSILIFRLDKIGILLISLNTLSIITLSFRHSKAAKKGHPLTCKIYSSGMSFLPILHFIFNTWCCLSTTNTFLPFIYIGNLNRRPFNILPSFCSSS